MFVCVSMRESMRPCVCVCVMFVPVYMCPPGPPRNLRVCVCVLCAAVSVWSLPYPLPPPCSAVMDRARFLFT